jgi:glycosyltransferase involved in cell wall biosynthesis
MGQLTDKAVLVADKPEDFAQAMLTVLQHPEKRKTMEAYARTYVVGHLAPETVYQPLVDWIHQHIQQSNPL